MLELIKNKAVNSAHDISEGGISICLAEKAILSKTLGCVINYDNCQTVGNAFGESQSRIVITANKEQEQKLKEITQKYNIKLTKIGNVIKNDFIINGLVSTNVSRLVEVYENAIPNIMSL